MRRIEKRLASNLDWSILVLMLMLCGCGLTVLYSAGYNPELQTSIPMRKQAAAMGVGLGLFFATLFFNANFWKRWAWIIYGACVFLLFVVFVMGQSAKGAQRWLDFGGGLRLQPSEMMKIGVILGLARLFSSEKVPQDGYNLFQLFTPGAILLVPVVLTLIQPDLGTALCQLLVGASLIYLVGVKRKTLITMAVCAAAGALPAWNMLKDYQRKRILNFLSPEMDPLGSGYHAIQSKIAVGSGALGGKGFLQGTQTQLRFLPEQTTDFLFSVLAEEWGFMGSVLVISIYAMLIYRVLRVTSRTDERFSIFVCFGVGALLFWQVLINIGMVTGILPVVGITLPLLSYGGSSVVTIMFGLGLVAGVSMRRFLFT